MSSVAQKKPRKTRVVLTDKSLKEIGKLLKKGVAARKIAKLFDVSIPTIYYHFKGGVRAFQPDIAEQF